MIRIPAFIMWKTIMQQILLPAFTAFICVSSFAQDKEKIQGTIRFDFMVPQPLTNTAFKKSFTGIMDVGTGVYLTTKGFVFGILGRYKQFQVPANKINNTVTTMQNIFNAGISLGYDHFRSAKTLITPGLNIGYNWIKFNRISCLKQQPRQTEFTAVNFEPFIKVDWMIDDGFGIGIMFSYNVLTYEFNPDDVCMNEFKTYNDDEKKGLSQSFSFGFCAYWNWAKRSKSEY